MIYENVFTPVASLTKSPVKTGGLCRIALFKWDDVFSWPIVDPATGCLATEINLKPGASMYVLECVDRGRIFTESKKRSSAGSYYDIEVNAELAGNSSGNTLSVATMDFHDFGIIVNDRDGLQRLIGSPDCGATLVHDYSSGDIEVSRKRKLKFTWQHPTKAPIYLSNIITITSGGITISVGRMSFITRFRVGEEDAPMGAGDTSLTDAAFANANLMVIASGFILPVDDLTGVNDLSGSIERHIEKALFSDTAEFKGGVALNELIEIYSFDSLPGILITSGKITLIARFKVGAADALINPGDATITDSRFANQYVLVVADGIILAVDDLSGNIDWEITERHIQKALADDTVTFVGGVVAKELIEIYTITP